MRMTMRYKVICYFLVIMTVMGGYPLSVSTIYACGGPNCETLHAAYLRAQDLVRQAQEAYDIACAAVVTAQGVLDDALATQEGAEALLALATIAYAAAIDSFNPYEISIAGLCLIAAGIALLAAIESVKKAAEALERAQETKVATHRVLTTAKKNAQAAYDAWQACLNG